MILILTEQADAHADSVAAKLEAQDVHYIRFNPADFPSKASISLSYADLGSTKYTLCVDGIFVDLSQVEAVWYRRPKKPIAHNEIKDKLTRTAVQEEAEATLQDLWSALDCFWVPAPVPILKTGHKMLQLKVASEVGFEIPPTLCTNNPKDFLDFYRHHNGNVISKRSGYSWLSTDESPFCRYTEVVSKRDVAYAYSLRFCPITFQAYVPKKIELRITVVGKKVFAAEIHSQTSNHTKYDWRRYDHNSTPYLPHTLPDEIADLCVRLVEKLGLCFGAIDMILTPEGRYIFIEINPNGQYLWIEYATGLPISDAVAELLINSTKKRNVYEKTSEDTKF